MATAEPPADLIDAQLTRVLRRSSPEVRRSLLEAFERFEATDALDEDVWGPSAGDAEYIAATALVEQSLHAARQRVIANSLTLVQAAELMQVSPQAIQQGLTPLRRRYVGFKVGGQWRLPEWQFQLRDTAGFALLADLQRAFAGDAVALTGWVREPNDDLEGAPLDALRDPDTAQRALTAAEADSRRRW